MYFIAFHYNFKHKVQGDVSASDTTSNQVKKTLDKVRVSLLIYAIVRCLHEWKCKEFTTRCKPKNKKRKLDLSRNHLKEPAEKILGDE